MRQWLDKLRRHLSNVATRSLAGEAQLQTRLSAANADIHEVNRRVNELTFA